jgi:hypothetical protein
VERSRIKMLAEYSGRWKYINVRGTFISLPVDMDINLLVQIISVMRVSSPPLFVEYSN